VPPAVAGHGAKSFTMPDQGVFNPLVKLASKDLRIVNLHPVIGGSQGLDPRSHCEIKVGLWIKTIAHGVVDAEIPRA
jgi:hypothetical protein